MGRARAGRRGGGRGAAVGVHRDIFLSNPVADAHRAVAGAALAALVAADPPSFQALHVDGCSLGDEGLGPLFDALPSNTRLRTLLCRATGLTAQCARDRLLPAVRANSGLRELGVTDAHAVGTPLEAAFAEAEAVVNGRSQAVVNGRRRS